MQKEPSVTDHPARARDTKNLASDTPELYRQKLARIALDGMYQFVALLDGKGTLLEANRAALDGAGLKLSDVEGQPFWDCFWWSVSGEVQDKLKESVALVARGEFIRYDVGIYGKAAGKGTISIDFSMIPVKDESGEVIFMVAEGRDITNREILREGERMKLEAAGITNTSLRLQFRQLSELFGQTSGFMTVLRGPDYVFEFANPAYYKLIGRGDIIGRPLIEALPELRNQIVIELLDHVRATGESYTATRALFYLTREPGAPPEHRYLDFVCQPLIGEDGIVKGIFVEGHDVTDQQRAEEDLRQADRRKDEFLATLAHELRNPLAPLRHAAMIGQAAGTTQAEMKWSHEVIDRQVMHMGRMLDDLLDVSRITSGKLELRKERLALNTSLFSAVETVRPLIEARGHQLITELPGLTTHIDADPVRFEQIISNLLSNAAKYTDRGGLIRVKATVGEENVLISVADNGIGISPELLPGLFEMFSQAKSSLDHSEGGLGIGLSLVRGLVALHGGTITASSPGIGGGSEFIVSLPLAPAAAAPAVVPAASLDRPGADLPGLRIMVVDDNRDNADLCSILFKKSGHTVRTAYSGGEALTIAAEFIPEFVLLDISMPDMNGYEVARRIREADWGGNALMVAVTGWGQEDDKQKAYAAGFDHHITKPFDFKLLKELLKQRKEAN